MKKLGLVGLVVGALAGCTHIQPPQINEKNTEKLSGDSYSLEGAFLDEEWEKVSLGDKRSQVECFVKEYAFDRQLTKTLYQSYGGVAKLIERKDVSELSQESLTAVYVMLLNLQKPFLRNVIGGGLIGDLKDTSCEWGGLVSLIQDEESGEGHSHLRYYLDEYAVQPDEIYLSNGMVAVIEKKKNSNDFSYRLPSGLREQVGHIAEFHQHADGQAGPSLTLSMGNPCGDVITSIRYAKARGKSYVYIFSLTGEEQCNVGFLASEKQKDGSIKSVIVNCGDYSFDTPAANTELKKIQKKHEQQRQWVLDAARQRIEQDIREKDERINKER